MSATRCRMHTELAAAHPTPSKTQGAAMVIEPTDDNSHENGATCWSRHSTSQLRSRGRGVAITAKIASRGPVWHFPPDETSRSSGTAGGWPPASNCNSERFDVQVSSRPSCCERTFTNTLSASSCVGKSTWTIGRSTAPSAPALSGKSRCPGSHVREPSDAG
jgi:hypothetical protein